ncbi:hypothetical protein [Curtobacterium sp. 24E2]|nr:hypothetical protein JN350_02435 [Curtobacterium sp. 24E2]
MNAATACTKVPEDTVVESIEYETSASSSFSNPNPTRFELDAEGGLTAYIRVDADGLGVLRFQTLVTVDGKYAGRAREIARRPGNVVDVQVKARNLHNRSGLASVYFIYEDGSGVSMTPVVAVPLRVGTVFNTDRCASEARHPNFVAVDVNIRKPAETSCRLISSEPDAQQIDVFRKEFSNTVPISLPLSLVRGLRALGEQLRS